MHKWLPFLGECLFALAAGKLRYKSVASETQVYVLVVVCKQVQTTGPWLLAPAILLASSVFFFPLLHSAERSANI